MTLSERDSMAETVDLYGSTYPHFTEQVSQAIRLDAFGSDIGQNSWTTAREYSRFIQWLGPGADSHVLEVACGSGGPAIHLARTAGCRVTGIDISESAAVTAAKAAERCGMMERTRFIAADAAGALPFAPESFDGIICIDAINHLPGRESVLREWARVLRRGGRAVFTDPVVVTGLVSNDELARRASIGFFLFAPPRVNEALIERAGLRLTLREDVTETAATIADRWKRARQTRAAQLIRIEGEAGYEGLQRFFEAVRLLYSERRLSRIAYALEKPRA